MEKYSIDYMESYNNVSIEPTTGEAFTAETTTVAIITKIKLYNCNVHRIYQLIIALVSY